MTVKRKQVQGVEPCTCSLKLEVSTRSSFQADDDRAHEIPFLPVFFSGFRMVVMIISATLDNSKVG